MNKIHVFPFALSLVAILSLSQCQQEAKAQFTEGKPADSLQGFQTLEDYGKHLVDDNRLS
ncbi:MAG: hypothetical protein WD426_09320 [Anditalea sp.]